MKDFNYFEEALEKSIEVKGRRRTEFYVMAKKGDITKFASTHSSKWNYKTLTLDETIFESYSDRKLESDRCAEGEVLVYDSTNMFISWKTVYVNTKGSYFKKHGKSYYI